MTKVSMLIVDKTDGFLTSTYFPPNTWVSSWRMSLTATRDVFPRYVSGRGATPIRRGTSSYTLSFYHKDPLPWTEAAYAYRLYHDETKIAIPGRFITGSAGLAKTLLDHEWYRTEMPLFNFTVIESSRNENFCLPNALLTNPSLEEMLTCTIPTL